MTDTTHTNDRGTASTDHDTSGKRTAADRTGGRSTRRDLLSATTLGLATAVSGCLTNPWGPDPDGDPAPDDGTRTGEQGVDEVESTPDGDTPLDREPAQVVEVAPDGFLFEPSSFEIDVGETVHWQWADDGHNVRVRSKPDGSDWEGSPGTAGDTYGEGYEHGHTFETPGEYVYFCAPHQHAGLEGSFTVR